MISFSDFLKESSPTALAKLAQLKNKKKPDSPISKQQLDTLEKHLDSLFKHLNIDIEFSRHFFERLHDARNGKTITIKELNDLFEATHKKFGVSLSNKKNNFQAVIKSLATKINVPFVININRNGHIELVGKTIMRKASFKTPNQELKV